MPNAYANPAWAEMSGIVLDVRPRELVTNSTNRAQRKFMSLAQRSKGPCNPLPIQEMMVSTDKERSRHETIELAVYAASLGFPWVQF